jgi:hypothetical protein
MDVSFYFIHLFTNFVKIRYWYGGLPPNTARNFQLLTLLIHNSLFISGRKWIPPTAPQILLKFYMGDFHCKLLWNSEFQQHWFVIKPFTRSHTFLCIPLFQIFCLNFTWKISISMQFIFPICTLQCGTLFWILLRMVHEEKTVVYAPLQKQNKVRHYPVSRAVWIRVLCDYPCATMCMILPCLYFHI